MNLYLENHKDFTHIARHWWLTPVILATWETEICRIEARIKPRKIVHETPPPKITIAKWSGVVAQVIEHLLYGTKL
jgi:hypothetical protein